ncbi:hypothetical protein ALC62_05434 [Cyphomyrmex costatus]|uniref:Gustatory receptor n=1 Tax=Cyphomyrmex costatus TaxID=456900 RepID=A0A195CSQ1_9HYME|nr:hypothetical protein ALC62_05434 [Cyphomyrmex costatus]
MFSLLSKIRERIKDKIGERRQLFHAMDFQSLMYPCFTFGRILGMHPYKINTLPFEISKPCYIISIITVCVFFFSSLIITINIPEWFGPHRNISKLIELVSLQIVGTFITIVTFVLSGPRIRLLKSILQISSRLSSESYQKPSILIHIKDIFGIFFLLVYTIKDCYKWRISVSLKLSALYFNLVSFQMNMLYINCIYVLTACFKKIDNDLKNLLIMCDQPHSVKWFCFTQRKSHLLMKLKALKKLHLEISNSVRMLNIIFSPQILATIVTIIIVITFELHFNVISWQNGLSIGWMKQIKNRITMPYVVFHAIKIALITWTCQTGKNQVIKINTTVHDVLNSTDDEQIKREVLKILISLFIVLIFYIMIHFLYTE